MLKSPLEPLRHIRDECVCLTRCTSRVNEDKFLTSEDSKRAFVRYLECFQKRALKSA
jgi:hypothetical protein